MQKYEDIINVTRERLQNKFYSQNVIPKDEDIFNWLDRVAVLEEIKLSKEDRQKLFDFLKKEATGFTPPPITIGRGRKRWMHERSDEQKENYYSGKYENYLLKKGEIPATGIRKIFKESDEILDLLENPLSRDGFKRKGLVMGDVQSGKTANYLGLINRAADVKYKLIILIAGLHINLRQQTQQRVIDGFIGRDSVTQESVGVGNIPPLDRSKTPISLTSLAGDFNAQMQNQLTLNPETSNVPVILVIKKNVSVLRSVITYLQDGVGRHRYTNNYPLLLIDDEADNASINYNDPEENPTRINEQIRELLNLFSKSSYVGYTATPFANIFIDPDADDLDYGDDLFPEDFIISLKSPDDYIGPNYCFLDDKTSSQIIRRVEDNEPSIPVPQPREDFSIDSLPDSCKKAIEIFLLSIALKIHRKTTQKHTSMLINITHKVDLQNDIERLVSRHLDYLLSAIRYEKDNTGKLSPELTKLQQIWIDEYESEGNFDDLLTTIDHVSGSIKLKLINSTTEDVLNYKDYDEGLHAIVVGGFSLSRGFTFEGLTISYLLRNSMMSDTVLQMGRWFGYRGGYKDLCRIFLLPRSFCWYRHIADMIQELRAELEIAKAYDLTPREYGMKIRNHPGRLSITAANKMRSGTNVRLGANYSAALFETNHLSLNQDIMLKNKECVDNLLSSLQSPTNMEKGYLWSDVTSQKVLDLVIPFDFPFDDQLVRSYIQLGSNEELDKWDIFLSMDGRSSEYTVANKFKVKQQQRTLQISPTNETLSFDDGGGRIVRIWDEEVGLSKDEFEKAEEARKSCVPIIQQTSRFYRQHRSKPLLILKVLDIIHPEGSIPDLYAFGISFPRSDTDRSVEYIFSRSALNNQINN